MQHERKHIKTFPGHPQPSDIFKPYLMGVELFADMDEIFRQARRMSAGEHSDEGGGQPPNMVEGQRAVAILTPGRLTMLDPCPEPNTVAETQIAPMGEMLPPDPPLTISVISYTRIEALTTDMNKAIPFRGFLNAWAYLGHTVVVFEGHPSAFESGVRNCDVLLIDSGMLPFLQFNWADIARRVMHRGGRIFIHDRETFTLSIVTEPGSAEASVSRGEADYAELLLRFLMRSSRSSVEITSGEVLPDLADLLAIDLDSVAKLSAERDKLNADLVIDILLQRAGWRWYRPFKTTGALQSAVLSDDGTTKRWTFRLTLCKNQAGKRQLQIER